MGGTFAAPKGGVGLRQRVKGVVGGAKKARAHIHAQACGWERWQR